MTIAVDAPLVPWWREPTKDQWMAWIAAWLGWMLNSFDFTIFTLNGGVPFTAPTLTISGPGGSAQWDGPVAPPALYYRCSSTYYVCLRYFTSPA